MATEGLIGFSVLETIGHVHRPQKAVPGRTGCEVELFAWLNTILGNLKTALNGTHHALKFGKYAHRYLADVQYRLNRRLGMASMVQRLLVAAARTTRCSYAQFTLKFRDYFWFHVVHLICTPSGHMVALVLALLIFAEQVFIGTLNAALWGMSAYLGFWILQFMCTAFMLHSRVNRAALADNEVEIQEGCLYYETPLSCSYLKWAGLVKAIGGPGFIAIYYNADNAHIIPDRAFASRAQRKEFLEQLQIKIARANA